MSIIAYTGAHSCGKTTSVFEKARDLKMKHSDKKISTLNENAANSPFTINKQTTEKSQMWIFCNQLQAELFLSTKFDLIVCDRTIIDSISYSKVAGFFELAESKYQLAKHHINIYNEIYFKTIANNNYLFEDGLRDHKDKKFRQDVEDTLLKLYERLISDGYLDKNKFFII